jgi:nitrate/nitrite transport system ATP-binding protein
MAFLSLEGVSKGYGPTHDRSEVLVDVNLQVQKGEFVAIVGYSGSGKTTLVSLVAGLVGPDAGTVTIDGRPVTGPGADRGVVFQNYSLLPWLTAYENVQLAVDQAFPDWTPDRKEARIRVFLQKVGLLDARNKRPSELSGGMRQRVALARALAVSPEVLLLDEPLGALDALTRATLQDEITKIWAADQKTVLLVTNDVDEAIYLADRIVPLSAGPRATLGPAVRVDLPRPRDRKALNHDPRFKEIRNLVIEYLLGPGRGRGHAGASAHRAQEVAA